MKREVVVADGEGSSRSEGGSSSRIEGGGSSSSEGGSTNSCAAYLEDVSDLASIPAPNASRNRTCSPHPTTVSSPSIRAEQWDEAL